MPSIPWSRFGRATIRPRRFPRVRRGGPRQKIVPLKKWDIVRGDTVMVLAGKDRGKAGEVSEVVRSKNWVFVKGMNCHQRYFKPTEGFAGGVFPSEAPLQVSEVSLIDPSNGQPTDVTYRYTETGEKVRVSVNSGRIIPKPQWERRDWKTRAAVKDGDYDTSSDAVAKATYVPSLLYFHEEILCSLKLMTTVRKTGAERRDHMMREIEKACDWTPQKQSDLEQIQLGLYDRVYLSAWKAVETVGAPFKRFFGR